MTSKDHAHKHHAHKHHAHKHHEWPLVEWVQEALEDAKAENIVLLELRGKTSLADWMLIASGISRRHLQSIADKVSAKLKEHECLCRMEGDGSSDWVLIDAGEVIVHIFQPETRRYYNLEKMWGDNFLTTPTDQLPAMDPKKVIKS